MEKEEFIDKIAIANKTRNNLNAMLKKVDLTKREAVSVFLEANMKLDPEQRVRVYKNEDSDTIENKKFLGFGYVRGAVVDEDHGIIFYPIVKEDKKTKAPLEETFESECAVLLIDYEYCSFIIEIA